jgi:hypothetical protein
MVTEKFPVLFIIYNETFYWNEQFTCHHIKGTVHCLKIDESSILKLSTHAKHQPLLLLYKVLRS